MENIPNDGSYFLGDCDYASCIPGKLVRKLRLDRLDEGATIHLCETHWAMQMDHRKWMNKYVSDKWDVYAFFHPDPQAHKILPDRIGRKEWSHDFIVWELSDNAEMVQMFVSTINGGANGHRNTANWKQDIPASTIDYQIDKILESFSDDELVLVIVLRADLPFKNARTFAQDIADYELALYDLNRRKKLVEKDDGWQSVTTKVLDLASNWAVKVDVWAAHQHDGVRFWKEGVARGLIHVSLDEIKKNAFHLRRDNVLIVLFDHTKGNLYHENRRKAVARLWLKEDFEDA